MRHQERLNRRTVILTLVLVAWLPLVALHARPATAKPAANHTAYSYDPSSKDAVGHGALRHDLISTDALNSASEPERCASCLSSAPTRFAAEEPSGGPTRWGPHNGPGPLDKIEVSPGETAASTFRSGSYTQYSLPEDTTLYHAYGGESGPLSSFWTRTMPSGPLQSQLDLALNPDWGNTAETFSTIRVPAGTEVFEGAAGPQDLSGGGSLIGGGNQIYIPWVDPDWLMP